MVPATCRARCSPTRLRGKNEQIGRRHIHDISCLCRHSHKRRRFLINCLHAPHPASRRASVGRPGAGAERALGATPARPVERHRCDPGPAVTGARGQRRPGQPGYRRGHRPADRGLFARSGKGIEGDASARDGRLTSCGAFPAILTIRRPPTPRQDLPESTE